MVRKVKSIAARSETGGRRHKAAAGYEIFIAEETHEKNHTQEVQEKSAETQLKRSEKPPWPGYEVADLTQDARSTRETRGRSTKTHTNTVTARQTHTGGYGARNLKKTE